MRLMTCPLERGDRSAVLRLAASRRCFSMPGQAREQTRLTSNQLDRSAERSPPNPRERGTSASGEKRESVEGMPEGADAVEDAVFVARDARAEFLQVIWPSSHFWVGVNRRFTNQGPTHLQQTQRISLVSSEPSDFYRHPALIHDSTAAPQHHH